MSRKNKNRPQRSQPDNVETALVLNPPLATENIDVNPVSKPQRVSSIESRTNMDATNNALDTGDNRVLEVVCSSAELLQKMQSQLQGLCEGMFSHLNLSPAAFDTQSTEVDSLRDEIIELECKVSELEQQNSDLAAQVAGANIRRAVVSADVTNETMSWEDRKNLILRQMESEDFDTDDFCSTLDNDFDGDQEISEDPASFVRSLTEELARREKEVGELRHLLEQQSATCDAGISIGAAGIAEMIDSDELVKEERVRLQNLQTEWEEKFRQGEIEASLERAKLSRERRELAAKQSELERELEKIRLNALQASEKGKPRKWLSELGLIGS